MFNLRKKAEEATSLLPALMIKAEHAAQNLYYGEHPQRKSGAGEKFWQFREYTAQDRPQDIDWRQSGKTDSVFIRQKERQLPQTALLWSASNAGMDFSSGSHPTKKESAHVLLLALCLLLTRQGERIGLLGESQTGRSDHMVTMVGNNLLGTHKKMSLPDVAPHPGQKHAALILAGDFLEPPEKIASCFANLARYSGTGMVIHTFDPAEIDIPWNGRFLFEHPESTQTELVQNVTSIRSAYAERIQKHIQQVNDIATQCGWNYVTHISGTPYEQTLIKIWNDLGLRRGSTAS